MVYTPLYIILENNIYLLYLLSVIVPPFINIYDNIIKSNVVCRFCLFVLIIGLADTKFDTHMNFGGVDLPLATSTTFIP